MNFKQKITSKFEGGPEQTGRFFNFLQARGRLRSNQAITTTAVTTVNSESLSSAKRVRNFPPVTSVKPTTMTQNFTSAEETQFCQGFETVDKWTCTEKMYSEGTVCTYKCPDATHWKTCECPNRHKCHWTKSNQVEIRQKYFVQDI